MAKKTASPVAAPKKPEKIFYPGLEVDAEGKPTKLLDNYPSDFNLKIHRPLRRIDFVNEAPLLNHKADLLQARVTELRQQAKDAAQFVDAAAKQSVMRLRKLAEQAAGLFNELKTQGQDVAVSEQLKALFASMGVAPTA